MQVLPKFLRSPYIKMLIMASLAINMLALALPIMTMQIYDRVMINHAVDTLNVLSLGVLVAAMGEFLLRMSRNSMLGYIGSQFEYETSVRSMEKIIQADPRVYESMSKAILMQDITSSTRLKDYYSGQIAATLLVDAPFAVLLLGLSFYLSGWLALVSLVILAAFGYASWKQGKKLKTYMREREEEDNRRYNFITQALQSVHTIKALCLEALMSRRFEEVQKENGVINYRIACVQGASSTLGYASAQFMTIAVICAGAPMVVNGSITVGILVACVMVSGQIMQPLQRGLGLWLKFQDITLARNRLTSLLSIPEREYHKTEELGANHGNLKLSQLRFSYAEGQPILDGANIEINPGEIVALQGASGAGKTTLLELLAGMYEPDKGQILLSGMEPWKIPASERGQYIGYLANKGMILKGSIMDNLSGFDSKRQNDVKKIVDLLGIEQAVASLPAGYDTPLEGLATDVVPPGLKQRIAMARALMFKPRFILYDNADQGLDSDSYARIFSLLARLKGKATIILVSDDRNILSLADKVIELRHGQLVHVMEPVSLLANRKEMGVL